MQRDELNLSHELEDNNRFLKKIEEPNQLKPVSYKELEGWLAPSTRELKKVEPVKVSESHKSLESDDIEEKNELLWDPFWETVLRAEFSEFDDYKDVRIKQGKKYVQVVHYCRLIIFNFYFIALITACVVYSLFGISLKYLCCTKVVDPLFDVLTFIVLVFFLFEFIIYIIGGFDYVISFYFWTDILSLVLLIFDLSFVVRAIYEKDTTLNKKVAFESYSILEILRLVRIIKLMKNFFIKSYKHKLDYYTLRLKLSNYKVRQIFNLNTEEDQRMETMMRGRSMFGQIDRRSDSVRRNKNSSNTTKVDDTPLGVIEATGGVQKKGFAPNIFYQKKYKESKIGRRMIYLTNKRIMMLLLIVLIIVPLFSPYFWNEETSAFTKDLNLLVPMMIKNPQLTADYIGTSLQSRYDEYHGKIVSISIPTLYSRQFSDINDYRVEELRRINQVVSYKSFSQTCSIDLNFVEFLRIQALLNIFHVIFVIFMFFGGIYYFNKDARDMILDPLERMIDKVKLMSVNPAQALLMGKDYYGKSNSDITLIEDTIQKLAYLLVLGFGEAGNSLLSKILYTKEFEIDFLSNPSTIHGIFGFCDIRNFTDATEILKEDVLMFVNTVADIVHKEVKKNEGGANKNIGDAFVVVWKLRGKQISDVAEFTKFTLTDEEKNRLWQKYTAFQSIDNLKLEDLSVSVHTDDEESQEKLFKMYMNNLSNASIAELSLISFLKIIARINYEKKIETYNRNPLLLKYLKDFKVNLGFGLHAGWAIEGAIGSIFKIDMSYLSPNVNMSARLEGLTKIYAVPFLFTGSLYNLFITPQIKDLCKRLDRVIVKGSHEPFELYTVDMNIKKVSRMALYQKEDHLPADITSYKNIRMENLKPNEDSLVDKQNEPNNLGESLCINESEYVDYNEIQRMFEYILMDKSLVALLDLDLGKEERLAKNFYTSRYKQAIDNYLKGNWKESAVYIKDIITTELKNKPLKVIHDYMESFNFQAPKEWKNFREIID